jgi:hypothetical protein
MHSFEKLLIDCLDQSIPTSVLLGKLRDIKALCLDKDEQNYGIHCSWIESELNGYKEEEKLPPYREVKQFLFSAGYQQAIYNVPTSLYTLEASLRQADKYNKNRIDFDEKLTYKIISGPDNINEGKNSISTAQIETLLQLIRKRIQDLVHELLKANIQCD